MNSEFANEIEAVKRILSDAKYVVFFGGAGVSTESGIPDFRSNTGLYSSQNTGNEYYLSKECLKNEPEKFYEFFRKNMIFPEVEPNGAHLALADLEAKDILKAVITQNVDGLHQMAGSERVIEIHGTSGRYYCTRCGKVFDEEIIHGKEVVPRCSECGGTVRPDVTLYGEALDGFSYREAANEILNADVLIVGGSSLKVYPAASLLDLFHGEHLIIINYSETSYDGWAEYIIRDSLSDVLSEIVKAL